MKISIEEYFQLINSKVNNLDDSLVSLQNTINNTKKDVNSSLNSLPVVCLNKSEVCIVSGEESTVLWNASKVNEEINKLVTNLFTQGSFDTLVMSSSYINHLEDSEAYRTRYSTALGDGCRIEDGNASHAEGYQTMVKGDYSHAEGHLTMVNSSASHAEGSSTQANGMASHAEGFNTIASSEYQHVQGKYNIEDEDNLYAHIVGNGTSTRSSNAHTLDWNGNAWYSGDLYIGGTCQQDVNAKKVATEEFVRNYCSEGSGEGGGGSQATDEEVDALLESILGGDYSGN